MAWAHPIIATVASEVRFMIFLNLIPPLLYDSKNSLIIGYWDMKFHGIFRFTYFSKKKKKSSNISRFIYFFKSVHSTNKSSINISKKNQKEQYLERTRGIPKRIHKTSPEWSATKKSNPIGHLISLLVHMLNYRIEQPYKKKALS